MNIRLKETLQVDFLEDKLVLFDVEKNNVIEMNEIGRIIVEDIQTNNFLNIEKTVERIQESYEIDCSKNQLFEDISIFVKDLCEIGVFIAS